METCLQQTCWMLVPTSGSSRHPCLQLFTSKLYADSHAWICCSFTGWGSPEMMFSDSGLWLALWGHNCDTPIGVAISAKGGLTCWVRKWFRWHASQIADGRSSSWQGYMHICIFMWLDSLGWALAGKRVAFVYIKSCMQEHTIFVKTHLGCGHNVEEKICINGVSWWLPFTAC